MLKKCLTDYSSGQGIAGVAKQSSRERTTALRGGGEIRRTPGSLAYKAVFIQGSDVEGHGGHTKLCLFKVQTLRATEGRVGAGWLRASWSRLIL